ncbi:oxygen-dependent choline dehydrogenase-like [Zophobas morio]|uniref:oxygen-dependent choline dehydrogenase-like n=1 Tax=Zophobas morio TaxID=2755281 RepID=UPI003083BAC5
MNSLFTVIIYLLLNVVNSSITTTYYKRLIDRRIREAMTYKLPKNNEQFRKGIESNDIQNYGEYDFVIVGAGSAGSVLATRLSEIANFNTLLLEAGDEEDDFNQIPAMMIYNQLSRKNWGYYSTPQKYSCLGMNNQQCVVPRGKLVGGSSSINSMMYIRGSCKDYDKWSDLGNHGWSCDDVFPYFKKSENSQIHGDNGYHGIGGFWNVEYSLPPSDLLENIIAANLGINQSIIDYNGINPFGSNQLQFSIKHGKRQSLAKAFLENARARSNLKLVTNVLVTKAIIGPQSNVTRGVEFVTQNTKFRVLAKKEVIVSAGAINTPQILMLSGIGPKKHLEEMGIPVIADLPVGKNLIEHPFLPLVLHTNYTIQDTTMEKKIDLYLRGLGPLTRPAGMIGVALINTRNGVEEVPTIEILFGEPNPDLSVFAKMFNLKETTAAFLTEIIHPKSDITISLLLLNPKSRGRVFLKSNSPTDFPNIDLNMLSKREDANSLIEAMGYVSKIVQTDGFKKINATLLDIKMCNNVNDIKRKLECLIRQMTTTCYHPCGTTAMGPDRTKFVVDDKLKVHGIRNLRVVDASIFPLPVSGHINAATVMVAEKAADVIKKMYEK